MAEIVLSLAILRISDLLFHEAVCFSPVRDEVKRLEAELKRMQSFLKDVNQDERLGDRVAEVKDLAYAAQDVIDTFVVKVAHQRGIRGIIKRFASIFTKPFHLHKMGVQVKAIHTKLEGIAYEISSEGEEFSSISMMKQQHLRRTYSHEEEEDVLGLERITRNVLAQLMMTDEEDRCHVVSIVGMGAISNTFLAKKVYNHNDVKRHFGCFAWASISQQCKLKEVLHDVLIKVLCPSKDEREQIDKLNKDELMKRLFDVMGEKRYLVVLDDIGKMEDLDLIKAAFPRGKKGSKILITTRSEEVALHSNPQNSPITLQLTNDESWKLFCKKAFQGNNTESDASPIEFESLGREMVKKCRGVPVAIAALGGMLATKSSWTQWEMIQRNIQQQVLHNGAEKGILVLSYNDLPYYLKPCFLYLGHYPDNWEISKKELFRLWIAEGFILPSMGSGGMLMEDVAEQFLEVLIDRCLVQVGKKDYTGRGVKTCRLHGLLWDLCVDKAREEKFMGIVLPSLFESSSDSLDLTLSESMPRIISIHPSERYVCLKGKHPNLHSLLLFQNGSLKNLHILECKSFNLLRVLYLVKRNLHKWHVSSEIGNLHLLRYLRLECKRQIFLPQSIGKLKSLHTLHVQLMSGSIRIPNVVFMLEHLRHILLFDNDSKGFCDGANMHFPVRDVLIETLKYVRIKSLAENNALPNLNNIRSFGVVFERSKDVEPILKAVVQSNRLQSLHMKLFNNAVPYPNLEPLSQCHNLSKLFLKGKIEENYRHQVLNFIPASIVKLTLWGSELKLQDPMVVLEKLPHLKILRLLGDSYKGTKLICSANGFCQLDYLEMAWLSELEEWEIEEGAMPCLKSLCMRGVHKLRNFPEGLRYLTTLQEMKLEDMKRSLVKRIQVANETEGEDSSKVSHIPSIRIRHTQED